MRKEEENSANVFLALACDDDEFDEDVGTGPPFRTSKLNEDVNLLTMNDVDDHHFEELVFGDELTLPQLHTSSHQLSQEHAHGRHNDVDGSFEEYCEIIARMKSSHDPKMGIASSM